MPDVIDGNTGNVLPPPPEDAPGAAELPLRNAVDVRREQAKVYREARAKRIDPADASKLIWMLGEIRKTIETEEIEKRLDQLETARGLPAPR